LNKASVRVLVSQPIRAYVGHISWHLPVDITCGKPYSGQNFGVFPLE